jgi:hypothetical protein
MVRGTGGSIFNRPVSNWRGPEKLAKSLKFLKLIGGISNSPKKQQCFDYATLSADCSLFKNNFYKVCNYFGETCYYTFKL